MSVMTEIRKTLGKEIFEIILSYDDTFKKIFREVLKGNFRDVIILRQTCKQSFDYYRRNVACCNHCSKVTSGTRYCFDCFKFFCLDCLVLNDYYHSCPCKNK